jgi:hypothetical protein
MELSRTKTLTAIFSDVLANLAFMFTDDDQVETVPGELWLETTIRYRAQGTGRKAEGTSHEASAGTLRFRCTRGFCVLLAANLLGIDADDDTAAAQGEDAVKEFMNIVCGQFVTSMYGDDDVFNLSIPQIAELSETPELFADDGDLSSTLSVDHHVVQLTHEPDGSGA